MDSKRIIEISSKYKDLIQKLDNDTLLLIVKNRIKALEYAKKGMEEVDPDNLTDENVRSVASEMQIVANLILEEKTTKLR